MIMRLCYVSIILFYGLIISCTKQTTTNLAEGNETEEVEQIDTTNTNTMNMSTGTFQLNQDSQAVVEAVSFSGEANNYTFTVQLRSPDTGCEQYADWWEVIDQNEHLIYRRILLHSHINEQPFTRSGGPVDIAANTFVYIRGHINTLGYGSLVFGGTVEDGFEAVELPIEFGADLDKIDPLPNNCAF